EFDAACEELRSKLASIIPIYFSDIDFILSYAAAGSYIRFFTLNHSGTLFPLTDRLNLTIRVDRLQAIRAVTNIIRIMITIKDTLPTNVLPLGRTLKKGDSTITFYDNFVEKRISSFNRLYPFANVNTLKQIYKLARHKRGLVHAKDLPSVKKGLYKVTLGTQGFHRLPQTEDEFRMIIEDILNGLVTLHDSGFVHRDIRWSNILRTIDGKYVLIDFEHSGLANEIPQFESLMGWDMNTLELGKYTCLSDMYQVGKLFVGESVILSEIGMSFMANLQNADHSARMTAKTALQHEWIIHAQ
ncbi:4305_t:CDS:1, partial [Paraglomus occultum]